MGAGGAGAGCRFHCKTQARRETLSATTPCKHQAVILSHVFGQVAPQLRMLLPLCLCWAKLRHLSLGKLPSKFSAPSLCTLSPELPLGVFLLLCCCCLSTVLWSTPVGVASGQVSTSINLYMPSPSGSPELCLWDECMDE